MATHDELRAYGETPDRFARVAPGRSVERFSDPRVCILQGPTWASVSGVRVGAGQVESLLAEVRERVPAEKEPIWWIGPSARPADLTEQLEGLGLGEPSDRAPLVHALALTDEPAGSTDVEVRQIETYDEFCASRKVQWEAFDTPETRRAKDRPRLREDFDEYRRLGILVAFLATIDGRPAGTALAVPSDRGVFLIGGSTARWARGRGAYRALVRARWEYAGAAGTPVLVTHAMPDTSSPILRRLGFEEVCKLRRLEDSSV